MTQVGLVRYAGLAAILAGLSYVIVGLLHPPNALASVTTGTWAFVHVLACTTGLAGLYGMVGLYVRQAEQSGWLGLIGFVLLSLWLAIVLCFSFVETLILPILASEAPEVVDALMRMFTEPVTNIDLGALPTLWNLSGILYILGGLIFGIATFRARVLPRWAGALLAFGTAIAPLAAMLPFDYQTKITIPVGIALAWMGYALWSEKRHIA